MVLGVVMRLGVCLLVAIAAILMGYSLGSTAAMLSGSPGKASGPPSVAYHDHFIGPFTLETKTCTGGADNGFRLRHIHSGFYYLAINCPAPVNRTSNGT